MLRWIRESQNTSLEFVATRLRVQTVDNGGLVSVRFLRIDAATNAVLESQTIVDPASRALTFPSIAANEFGDVVIGVTGTSTSEYASSYAIVGKTAGGITTFNPPTLLHAGVGDYERLDSQNKNRWGDYSATNIDPADPAIFWTSQEFVSSTDHWSTQVTELIAQQPNEARWAVAMDGMFDDPALWGTAHGGVPQATDQLVISRPTDLGGSYTIFVPPAPSYMFPSASIRQGNVVLDLGGSQIDLALHLEVGPYAGHPQATIANGTINSVAGFIAPSATSEGHLILDNAQWSVAADLSVGSAPAPSACCGLPGASGGIGILTIDNNAQVDVGGTLTVWYSSAVNLIDGVLTADSILQLAPPLPGGGGLGLNLTGGTLQVNRFDGILINSGGTLAPGGKQAVGTTDVNLIYDQLTVGGKLAIDIAGANPGDYDHLTVSGDALLGELEITLLGGFTPSLGQTFEIVDAGGLPPTGIANLLVNTIFPSTGSNWLQWQVFHGLNPGGVFALTLAIVPSLTGDFNADGTVDAADYILWRKQNGQSGIGLSADSNFDGIVDIIDFLTWRLHFGQSIPGPGSGTSAGSEALAAIPEPATTSISTLTVLFMALLRRRRSQCIHK